MKQHYFVHLILSTLFIVTACSQSDESRAQDKVKKHPHLDQCLDLYPQVSRQSDALYFLLANAPERDLSLFCADSLKSNIDAVYAIWDTVPWASEYSGEQFFNYVLPSRVSIEPLEYYWRTDCPRWLDVHMDEKGDMLTLARKINRRTKLGGTPVDGDIRSAGYTEILSTGSGKCDERAVLCVMAMRSMGIPAAFDYIPQRGHMNIGHSICSVILPDGGIATFQETDDDGENVFIGQKTPKVYRYSYAEQRNTVLYKYRNKESIPPLFSDFHQMDVTAVHNIGQRDVSITLQTPSDSKIAYLALFTPTEWNPVAYAKNQGKSARFEAIGTGAVKTEDIFRPTQETGNGILYLPCYYTGNKIVPASDPVIISATGIRSIVPDTVKREKVLLARKYPRFERIIEFADLMVGGIFESASRADFSDAQVLTYITETPLSRMQRVEIQVDKPFRYIRYRKPKETFSLGEIRVLDTEGNPLPAKPVCCEAITELEATGKMFDGDPLTYFSLEKGLDLWAGVKLDKPRQTGFIEFCPRNDDNGVWPGDTYELFFWDGAWKSLGKQQASDYYLEYTNAPQGALLWLRNLTRGIEERPFTWENGRQVFW